MREVQYLREYHRNCCETHQLSPEFWIESKNVKYVYSYCISSSQEVIFDKYVLAKKSLTGKSVTDTLEYLLTDTLI